MKVNYKFFEPLGKSTSMVFSSPHSGSQYFDWFLAQTSLDLNSIRSSEDAFVGEIFESVPFFGAFLIESMVPRTILDLNRARSDLDPQIIADYYSRDISSRVASGLGIVPRVVGNGKKIYSKKLTLKEVQDRIRKYYNPYHERLAEVLEQVKKEFGRAILLDCHSMPSDALNFRKKVSYGIPDIILGDRFGMSCDFRIVDFIEKAFIDEGFNVCRNIPFSGGYITQVYGQPVKNIHAVQIEINRALYMNEKKIEKKENFDSFCESIKNVVFKISQLDKYLPAFEYAAE